MDQATYGHLQSWRCTAFRVPKLMGKETVFQRKPPCVSKLIFSHNKKFQNLNLKRYIWGFIENVSYASAVSLHSHISLAAAAAEKQIGFLREIPKKLRSDCFSENLPLGGKKTQKKWAKNVNNWVSSKGSTVDAGREEEMLSGDMGPAAHSALVQDCVEWMIKKNPI